MRAALYEAGRSYHAAISMHSLRRGGARTAQSSGASRTDIGEHGTWASDSGLNAYIPSDSSLRISANLASAFGPLTQLTQLSCTLILNFITCMLLHIITVLRLKHL